MKEKKFRQYRSNQGRSPEKMEKACPSKKWENKSCAIKRPFDYKWQVKIPTVILYFDKVYVGDELLNNINLENYN